jgi:hypothetical protein
MTLAAPGRPDRVADVAAQLQQEVVQGVPDRDEADHLLGFPVGDPEVVAVHQ